MMGSLFSHRTRQTRSQITYRVAIDVSHTVVPFLLAFRNFLLTTVLDGLEASVFFGDKKEHI
jgi:hypothetical protein